ncbi:MAG: 4-hydroxy-tetrahydrodipicolinate synthase [Planctomycetota bacterium]
MTFAGLYVALVTPFSDGKVDYGALQDLVLFHLDSGTTGLVPCGTTGESATLSHEEHRRVIETVIQTADGQCQVIAGTGSNSTAEAIEMTKHAKEAGADGALVITPYYNKPTQEGLYRHFRAVADAVQIPIMLYNVPSRTAVNMLPDTVIRLADHDNIVAIKEASGDLSQATEILRGCEIDVLSGDDPLTLPLMAIGGTGVVSVVGNIVPKEVMAMIEAFNAGNLAEARKAHQRLYPLCKSMFLETNPIPVKTAMKLLGRGNGEMRLPMCEMKDETRNALQSALTQFGMTGNA